MLLIVPITVNGITVMRKLTKTPSVFGIENEYPDHSSFQPTEMGYMYSLGSSKNVPVCDVTGACVEGTFRLSCERPGIHTLKHGGSFEVCDTTSE